MRDQIYLKLESNSFWEVLLIPFTVLFICHTQTVSFNYILGSRIICFDQLKGSVTDLAN